MNTIEWVDGKIRLLDQTRLPLEEVYLDLADYQSLVRAIKEMRIRGAPALGVAAAYGVALGAAAIDEESKEGFESRLWPVYEAIVASRPTAVNIRWAVDRTRRVVSASRPVYGVR